MGGALRTMHRFTSPSAAQRTTAAGAQPAGRRCCSTVTPGGSGDARRCLKSMCQAPPLPPKAAAPGPHTCCGVVYLPALSPCFTMSSTCDQRCRGGAPVWRQLLGGMAPAVSGARGSTCCMSLLHKHGTAG